METDCVLKGHVCYSQKKDVLETRKDHYVVCQKGVCRGVFPELPPEYEVLPVKDFGDRLIIPGLVDLHVHAPQYAFRGLGMDLELLDWLEEHVFSEEAKFADLEYAERAYGIFVDSVAAGATTRACVFGTLHVDATLLLMDLLEDSGVMSFVGKVNMDRNAPDYLREGSYKSSSAATIEWLEKINDRGYKRTKPILTPRFTPSCTDELLGEIRKIQRQCQLPVQSHLSENPQEVAWVKELCPWAGSYADTYQKFGLFGAQCPTVMAHCVYCDEEEIHMMKERGVYVAHCPESNANLSSGVAPIRKFLEEGIRVGLGSDIAAGSTENMFRAMAQAIQVSKLLWRMQDHTMKPLTVEETFYLATKGGGQFFGKVGSFEPGYEFDAVILDDRRLKHPEKLTVRQRLERLVYLADEREVYAKYVKGVKCK